MTFLKYSGIAAVVLSGLAILIVCVLGRKPLRCIILNIAIGVAALAAVNITARFTGVYIPVNEWTVGGSAVFGMPGVCGIILLQMIFGV